VREQIGGSVTARVTWGNPATTFEELDALVADDSPFDYLYWQFVADEMYGAIRSSGRKAVLVQLIERFFARTDRLYPLIPLMGIVRNKLLPNRAQELYAGRTQCRVSSHLINVMPNGQIYPCPDMMYVPADADGQRARATGCAQPAAADAAMPCSGCEAYGLVPRQLHEEPVPGLREERRALPRATWSSRSATCCASWAARSTATTRRPGFSAAKLPLPLRRQLTDCEVYEYVEVMP
jgi:uncharacterized protein